MGCAHVASGPGCQARCVCIIEVAYLLSTEELYFIERGVSPSKPRRYKKVFVGGGRYSMPLHLFSHIPPEM